MIVSKSELLQKINATLVHLKRQSPIDIEAGGIISTLEDTLNLLNVTSLQFGLEEFPYSEEGCQTLIQKDENDLTEYDLEGLKYLAESVRWALDVVS